jgi:FkbM family methyltransferase
MLNLLAEAKNDFYNLIQQNLSMDAFLIKYMLKLLKKIGLQNLFIERITFKLSDDLKIFFNDEATFYINIPDHYIRREYLRHPDYIPRKGWVVFDIGAYIGIYSLWAAKRVDEEGFVVAFEPNPLAFRWLISNIMLNKMKNIKALPFALGDKSSKATLYVARENIEASSLIKDHLINNPSGYYTVANVYTVPILSLDYIIDKSNKIIGRAINHIDLVKIDVEGYEMNVLKGAEKTLNKGSIERLIIEVHLDQVSTKDLLNYLQGHSYFLDKIVRFDHVKEVTYLRLKY